jgi:hypothetical protein
LQKISTASGSIFSKNLDSLAKPAFYMAFFFIFFSFFSFFFVKFIEDDVDGYPGDQFRDTLIFLPVFA